MKAIVMDSTGGPEVLRVGEVPDLKPGRGEVLIKVRATALNRADLLQRRGLYLPPDGDSDILGLELAGEVAEVGTDVIDLTVGQRVAALVPGGGYAGYAVIPAGMAMLLPQSLTFTEGAAIPEAFLTAYLNLFEIGRLSANQVALIHAGASGVGTSAIQLSREVGATTLVTAGSSQKIDSCISLGALAGWDYHKGSFVDFVHGHTNGNGVDIILDSIGAPYFEDNVASLATAGKLIVVGTMGGSTVDNVNLGMLLAKRQQIIGTVLRYQSVSRKIELTGAFWAFAVEAFATGRMGPVIDSVFDWRDVSDAHRYMEDNRNIGKIVLQVTD